jgi:hypothetical protein
MGIVVIAASSRTAKRRCHGFIDARDTCAWGRRVDRIHWTNWMETHAFGAGRSAPHSIRIGLPSAARGVGWMDVRLEADNHVVETVAGKSRVAALRLISATLVD